MRTRLGLVRLNAQALTMHTWLAGVSLDEILQSLLGKSFDIVVCVAVPTPKPWASSKVWRSCAVLPPFNGRKELRTRIWIGLAEQVDQRIADTGIECRYTSAAAHFEHSRDLEHRLDRVAKKMFEHFGENVVVK